MFLPSNGWPYVVEPPRQKIRIVSGSFLTGNEAWLKNLSLAGAVDAIPLSTTNRGCVPENPTKGSSPGSRAGTPAMRKIASIAAKKRTQTTSPITKSRARECRVRAVASRAGSAFPTGDLGAFNFRLFFPGLRGRGMRLTISRPLENFQRGEESRSRFLLNPRPMRGYPYGRGSPTEQGDPL